MSEENVNYGEKVKNVKDRKYTLCCDCNSIDVDYYCEHCGSSTYALGDEKERDSMRIQSLLQKFICGLEKMGFELEL
jgi:hypothetical protein